MLKVAILAHCNYQSCLLQMARMETGCNLKTFHFFQVLAFCFSLEKLLKTSYGLLFYSFENSLDILIFLLIYLSVKNKGNQA